MPERQPPVAFNLLGFGDIKRKPISGWQDFLQEGKQYLFTADSAYANGRKAFTAEILYNLVAMSIEKLIMALLMKSGNLPYNHTMHDLVESMEKFLPGTLTNIDDELRSMDRFQEICDIERYTIKPPAMHEIARMLELAKEVQSVTLSQTAG
jgi:hypothetical protein